MDVTVNGNGQSSFFFLICLNQPSTLQNYFFIHIPKQQLSTYYKIKVAVPLFSEILQNKWLDETRWLDMTGVNGNIRFVGAKLLDCLIIDPWFNHQKFAPSDSLTKQGVDT